IKEIALNFGLVGVQGAWRGALHVAPQRPESQGLTRIARRNPLCQRNGLEGLANRIEPQVGPTARSPAGLRAVPAKDRGAAIHVDQGPVVRTAEELNHRLEPCYGSWRRQDHVVDAALAQGRLEPFHALLLLSFQVLP